MIMYIIQKLYFNVNLFYKICFKGIIVLYKKKNCKSNILYYVYE